MIHAIHPPHPPLDRLVDCFWISDEPYRAETALERVLPTGAQAVVLHLGEGPMRLRASEASQQIAQISRGVVLGPRSRPLVIDTRLGPTIGVHFKAGGARPFFDFPADALAECAVSLEDVWGTAARSLHQRLLEEPTARGRLRLLEDDLLARLRRAPGLPPALQASIDAFEEPDLASVAEVNRRTGLSPKRLIALFRDEVGLSPKEFWRVRRFRAALHALDRGAMGGGAALAADCGYFDQAHFVREFHRLAGSSPGEYLAARGPFPNHVPLRG